MKPLELFVMDRHCSVLGLWMQKKIQNAILVHLDEHPDADGLTDDELALSRRIRDKIPDSEQDTVFLSQNGFLHIGNYVNAALQMGIIRKVFWVRPDFSQAHPEGGLLARQVFRERGLGISSEEWNEYRFEAGGICMLINGIKWYCCSLEGVSIQEGESVLVDIDADYFGLSGSLEATAVDELRFLCWHPQTVLVTFSWSREGGFISRRLWRHLAKLIQLLQGKGEITLILLPEKIFPVQYHLDEMTRNLYAEALYLLRKSKYREALSKFLRLVAIHSDIPGLHYSLGLAYRRQGNIAAAEFHFQEAIRLAPWSHAVLNDLGTLLLETNRINDAVRCFSAAERARGGTKETPLNMGLALFQQGHWDEAAACFQEALRRQPVYTRAAYMLGLALVKSGQHNVAKDVFMAALKSAEPGMWTKILEKIVKEI